MNDDEIIALFFKRDERAVAQTQEKYGRLCRNIANNILQQPQDAEECVSDALLAVWNAIPPDEPEYFSAYICKTVKRFALDKLRYRNAAKRRADNTVSLDELAQCIPSGAQGDGLSELETKRLGRTISDFLYTQSETNRKVFVRRYWYGDSVADISEQFDIKEKTVATILFRMRAKLKKYLEKEGYAV